MSVVAVMFVGVEVEGREEKHRRKVALRSICGFVEEIDKNNLDFGFFMMRF